MTSQPIYRLRATEVYSALETSPQGLTAEQVAERLSLYGRNVIQEPTPPPWWSKFLVHIVHPMAILLWVAGILALIVGEISLALVIWSVILVNAAFSFWREYRATVAVAGLKEILPSYSRVLREGREILVPTPEIVPGDILILAEGDNIPADARVVQEYGLRVNQAILTGEAMPARKTSDASLREGISELERPNLVFAGTSVFSGTAKAVVYATGMLTQFGRIAHLTGRVSEQPSALQQEIIHLTRRLSVIGLGIGIVVFLVGAFDPEVELFDPQDRLVQAFIFALGILVAVVPEGLPATLSLSLAMAVQRLAQRGVLVKKLAMVETLGNISVICTDKSGTLTQNQMTVREIWVGGKKLSVSGIGYEPQGEITPDPRSLNLESELELLLTAATLCNNSRLIPPTADHPYWSALGDSTEAALRVVARKGGLSEEEVLSQYPRLHEIPFEARRKRMTTIHRWGQEEIAFVKGAPREVLHLCRFWQCNNQVLQLEDSTRNQILAANDDYARNALRVLAFAYRLLPPRSSYAEQNVECELIFLGLMAMHDPPRPEVARAVEICRQAGIRIIMVTGDYGLTAESIARRIGMLSTPNPMIVTGAELEEMNDVQLQNLLEKEVIYARMAPEHKLRLVAALQAKGEVVAVTGDGVNDAPALRKADVGVAMGIIGTDVAREAADVILTQDNFSTIVDAIQEGRAIYDNIRKFITYIFTSNVPELVPFVVSAIFQIPLALTVRQILAIDMGTDLLPALALGAEKPEPDIMSRPPRKRGLPLIERSLLMRSFAWLGMIETALCYLGFFYIYARAYNIRLDELLAAGRALPELLHTVPPHVHVLAVTMFHAGVVMAQVGNVLACRSERLRVSEVGWFSNPLIWLGILGEIALILTLIYVPPLAEMFDHQPLPLEYWFPLALFGPLLYGFDRVRKQLLHFFQWLKTSRESPTETESF
ncbi:MAG: cation-transporting P-type ATPase [Anaerolineales bacterium]|nr:cation-transporting P-type ATPase [Anaerolineales bacterium]MCS7247934.1 cation-transporting P-type ATPase [Anaerolineales bacterium]MDW8161744.1 cation-transporting P-type ATPase [Anaerolineales bacterium]MDW8446759.1 cation-transporting P-type ATPase [Anaerolineales bacterium]